MDCSRGGCLLAPKLPLCSDDDQVPDSTLAKISGCRPKRTCAQEIISPLFAEDLFAPDRALDLADRVRFLELELEATNKRHVQDREIISHLISMKGRSSRPLDLDEGSPSSPSTRCPSSPDALSPVIDSGKQASDPSSPDCNGLRQQDLCMEPLPPLETLGNSFSDNSAGQLKNCVVERCLGIPWGLKHKLWHPYVEVAAVSPGGAIAKHNHDASTQTRIRQYDLINCCNGCSDPGQIVKVLQNTKCNRLDVHFIRPQRLNMTVVRNPGEIWGIVVESCANGNALLVKEVEDGQTAWAHNHTSLRQQKVATADVIISVNGIFDDPQKMKAAMKAANTVQLQVLRVGVS